MSKTGVKCDVEKKQHFDDIYVEATPVPYKTRILDALDYVSDDFSRQMFDAHVLPWARKATAHGSMLSHSAAAAGHKAGSGRMLNLVELGCCFGNTTMATVHGMSCDAIRENWSDEEKCRTIDASRRIPVSVTGIDASMPALDYGVAAGLYDEAICADLNERDTADFAQVEYAMADADILICTGALVYLDLETIEVIIDYFANGKADKGEGYVLVNFLNPFGPEKADAAKRILLKHLDFVGSRAARHRRMSELERRNYPGEEWSLSEIWVLKRR